MKLQSKSPGSCARRIALGLALCLTVPLVAGCGRSNQEPVSATRGSREEFPPGPAGQKPGLTGRQKVAVLVGAAALYYLWKTHQNAAGAGSQGKYYLSKNGRVYYRDANGNPHWVTPPRIEVPADQAQEYSRFAGYNNRATGETFGGYGATSAAPAGGPPGPPGR